MSAEAWLAQLHENGYRITKARGAVVEVMQGSHRALTPVEVYDLARKKYRALGLVTVYRTLEKLEELSLVQRVHQAAGCQAFISACQGHQHLLICEGCGQIAFFDGDDVEPLIRSVSKKTGYEIKEHWLQLFGLCENCRA